MSPIDWRLQQHTSIPTVLEAREPGVGVLRGCRSPGAWGWGAVWLPEAGVRDHGATWLRACFLVSLHGGEKEPRPLTAS